MRWLDKTAAVARPTKLTEERADDLAVLLAAGVPVEVAARSVNVSRRTLDRWLRQDVFRERVRQARDAGPEGSEAASEARLVVLLLRAAAHDWRASAWYLERRFPDRWAERTEPENASFTDWRTARQR